MKSLIKWINNIIQINSIKKQIENRLDTLELTLADLRENQFNRDFVKLLNDKESIKSLNVHLSTVPVIWGDENRLEISEKAAVGSCLFNTNSGKIKIGEYTFAGSNVSILTGSHDPELTGFLRRDTEYSEGFDIEIGSGVWLASNVTVLGPCKIEDNAVVAAGAVVLPGTHIHKGELYAGVPARKIKDMSIITDLESSPKKLIEVIERGGGVLFCSGWSEKKVVFKEERNHLGHLTEGNDSVLYTNKEKIIIALCTVESGEAEVHITNNNKTIKHMKVGSKMSYAEINTVFEGDPVRIVINSDNQVFVSWEEGDL